MGISKVSERTKKQYPHLAQYLHNEATTPKKSGSAVYEGRSLEASKDISSQMTVAEIFKVLHDRHEKREGQVAYNSGDNGDVYFLGDKVYKKLGHEQEQNNALLSQVSQHSAVKHLCLALPEVSELCPETYITPRDRKNRELRRPYSTSSKTNYVRMRRVYGRSISLFYEGQKAQLNLDGFSQEEIKKIFLCLFLAIEHCARLGFCHMDIRTENVIIDDQGYPVLIDWDHISDNLQEVFYRSYFMFHRLAVAINKHTHLKIPISEYNQGDEPMPDWKFFKLIDKFILLPVLRESLLGVLSENVLPEAQQARLLSLLTVEDFFKALDQGNLLEVDRHLSLGLDLNALIERDDITPISLAIDHNDKVLARYLLSKGANPNIRGRTFGLNAIMRASTFSDLEMLKILVDLSREILDFNLQSHSGQTALEMALYNTNTGIVKYLIDQKIMPKTLAERCKLFRIACQLGNFEVVKYLLPHVYINAQNFEGRTPLMTVIADEAMVELFLTEPTLRVNIADDEGFTALMFAAQMGKMHSVQSLLNKGADPFLLNKDGFSALGFALKCRHFEIAEILLKEYESIGEGELSSDGILSVIELGKLDLMKTLLHKGLDLNLKIKENSILIEAVTYGHAEMIEFLLMKGAQIDFQGKDDLSALMFAVICNNQSIVNLLLAYGANLDLQDNRGYTALTYACRQKNTDMVRCFISLKADINIPDKDGNTPLMHALTGYDCMPVLEQLLAEKHLDIDARNHLGDTALLKAVYFRKEEEVIALLKAKADVNIKNKLRKTALSVHLECYPKISVVSSLLEKGAVVSELDMRRGLIEGGRSDLMKVIREELHEQNKRLKRKEANCRLV